MRAKINCDMKWWRVNYFDQSEILRTNDAVNSKTRFMLRCWLLWITCNPCACFCAIHYPNLNKGLFLTSVTSIIGSMAPLRSTWKLARHKHTDFFPYAYDRPFLLDVNSYVHIFAYGRVYLPTWGHSKLELVFRKSSSNCNWEIQFHVGVRVKLVTLLNR